MRPIVTLLTDFGTEGPYAAALRGVLLARCPDATIVDLTHEIPRHDIPGGAYVLAAAAPWYPAGTVNLAVVDPGVGGPRRAVAVVAGGQFFVGPDNGLFTLVAERGAEFREIDPGPLGVRAPSATFHGRDLFAPAAAALASGTAFAAIGAPVTDPVRLDLTPRAAGGRLSARVLHVDRFGNVTTAITPADLTRAGFADPAALTLDDPRVPAMPLVRTYGEGPPDRPFLLWGSSGRLEIALDRASAAARLGVRAGDEVVFAERGPL